MAEAVHYIAHTGLDWLDPKTGEKVRVEVGDRCDDVPEESAKWLLRQGLIERVDKNGKPLKKKGES